MDDPLIKRNLRAFANGGLPPARAERAGIRLCARPDESGGVEFHLPVRAGSVWRNALFGACVVIGIAGWCAASHVSADMLDAAAVMALMETSGGRGPNAAPLVSHDPHFIELTPVGFELVASRTRNAGKLTHIDEFDYRNADGDAVILLTARAPLASEEPHWSARRVGDLRLLAWTIGGKRYVLAGHAGTRGLMHAADALTIAARKAE
ncbi:hypothetical protein AWB79_01167 [Caballeronia hypogeia]|uniref:Transmembrane transcriptional regulator (Anti-sigma factor) n=1 Tax=Caballeronia hypogeia TaxID=1777140 RepID=A0A157ZMP2_9BURK|nr:hypothetical protein [Caballeronia hypogeia]SAK46778.1 hypothetical protein AWB79_01167 [Caballeronia hypogeia]